MSDSIRELISVVNTTNTSRYADVIFVHGINANPRTTWMTDNKLEGFPEESWLYWLGEDIPDVAVWTLGYPADAGIFGEHLRRHLWNLQQHPELAQAFQQVIFSDRSVILESMLAFKLNGMGLVDLQGNEVIPRHDRLYRPYFRSRLSLCP
jgi:hypothetical protein